MEIRRFFVENGFEILTEDACIDSGKIYCAMAAEYTGRISERKVSYIYTGKLPECGKPEAKLYLENMVSRLRTKHEAEKIHGNPETASYLKKIISQTEEIINEMQTDC